MKDEGPPVPLIVPPPCFSAPSRARSPRRRSCARGSCSPLALGRARSQKAHTGSMQTYLEQTDLERIP